MRYDTSCECLGFQFKGPTNVFCDNRGVVLNSSRPELTLQHNHNAINYHVVREAAAADILKVGKEDKIDGTCAT